MAQVSHILHFKELPPIWALRRFRWAIFNLWWPVLVATLRYRKILDRVRRKTKDHRLKVLFVVGTVSKWKAQSLYDLMRKSEDFDPCVALTICDCENNLDEAERERHLDAARAYFEQREVRCIEAYSRERHCTEDLCQFGADIVIYHQPWDVASNQLPHHVAKTALTFYIPYYVPNYGDLEFDCATPFHRTVFGFCTLSQDWSILYERQLRLRPHTCRFLPVGHTALDAFRQESPIGRANSNVVIYAPHWSVDHPGNANCENFSTFLWTAKPMLEYARQHPEFKWVFKPHPTLRFVLVQSGAWTEAETTAYYQAWNEIGVSCMDGDYQKLFMRSRAMITDCGSFLMEYPCTGHPLVHLISPTCKVKPVSASAAYFDTFYQVHDLDEFSRTLEMVVERGHDPKREARLLAASKAGLFDNYAAENFMIELRKLLAK